MKTFVTSEISVFLKAVDRFLESPVEVIVIGGAAAALAYRVVDYTKDIDTFKIVGLKEIQKACEKATQETGLNIPIEVAAVADAPYDFESRLVTIKTIALQKLKVLVPEAHDLALMKIMRANQNDITTIVHLKENGHLELSTLVERFKNEMRHVVADKERLRLNLLSVVEAAFSEDVANQTELLIPQNWAEV